MSKASEAFAESILDAEHLLQHFDELNKLNDNPPPPELEVLKRAGLVMAMTAWETYVEDRLEEAAADRLSGLSDPSIADLVTSKLAEEIRRLNNPASGTTLRLFRDYANVNLRASWQWYNVDFDKVCERLDGYLRLRGEVVHRSRQCGSTSHPVKRVDLQKAIRFLRILVEKTESGLTAPAAVPHVSASVASSAPVPAPAARG